MSYDKVAPMEALTGSLRDYRDLPGSNLLTRVEPFFVWQDLRRKNGLWPYSKSTDGAPKAVCTARDDLGRQFSGVNFASQDYLSLSSHPAVKEAAKAAIEEYGVHSAGSGALLGNTKFSLALERKMSDFLGLEHVVLYPTGWAAGFGVIQGLVRPDDHVVIDVLAHSCLHEGANAATRNVHLHGHLNVASVRRHLSKIRARDSKNGILVVTESLFSMDSDTPDLAALRTVCREFDAVMVVDVAHDLGCIGEDGRGHLALQRIFPDVDIIVGSFSKTFASNGGFVAIRSQAVKEYLKYYSASQTFSNALSPVQAATIMKSFDIIQSREGRNLRAELFQNAVYLRDELQRVGLEVLGNPSALVPVMAGAEGLARIAARRLPDLGVVANLVEYPAVAKNSARFRLQVMAKHSRQEIDILVDRLRMAIEEAELLYRPFRLLRSGTVPGFGTIEPLPIRVAVGQ